MAAALSNTMNTGIQEIPKQKDENENTSAQQMRSCRSPALLRIPLQQRKKPKLTDSARIKRLLQG